MKNKIPYQMPQKTMLEVMQYIQQQSKSNYLIFLILKFSLLEIGWFIDIQWCAYQNHNTPIYEVNDPFLT